MPYIEWRAKWFGGAFGAEYREGRTIAQVRPDLDGQRWYWSVHWPKHTAPPKKNADGSQWVGGGIMPAVTKWGYEPSEAAAKTTAERALGRGRNG